MPRFTWRLTLSGTEFGIDHVGVGKWKDGEPVALMGTGIGPFDTYWTEAACRMDEMLDEQLTLF